MFVFHQKDIDRVPFFTKKVRGTLIFGTLDGKMWDPAPGFWDPDPGKMWDRTWKIWVPDPGKYGTRTLENMGPWKIWDPDP